MWFTVKKINNYIWAFAEFKHFEEVISYLVIGKKKALLVDTGLGIKDIKKEVEKITDLPIIVINTHSHFDHVGGNSLFDNVINVSTKNRIVVEPFEFNVIKTPGHSPDSVCFYEKNRKWLFSGDTLYSGPIYLHLRESNVNDYLSSLIDLMKIDIKEIYPAHNDFNFPKINIARIYKSLTKRNKRTKKIVIDKETSLLLK